MFNFNPSPDIMKRYNLGAQIGNSINSINPGENGNGPSGGGMMPQVMMPQQPPPMIDSGPSMPPPMGGPPSMPQQMPQMQRQNPGQMGGMGGGMGRPQPQGQGGNSQGSPLWKRYMQMMAQQSGGGMNSGMGMR
jgi:hypothetical protein